ncbi:hypothetical protein CLV30_102343 [Haloactinopolyspora alba]|uniref:Uncharacterized protein n=1 Tax=Haloactinopolyspora alba TaxID=648780 RepID=A0A2P8EBX7_9ACTN|nr:DUF6703 family protein [Haloactinopolyspora alba]PSL06954.1 hypothetical protein CLV30_102343 [Haloactinopolyspora alba]
MPQNRRQPRRTPNRRPQAPGQGSRAPRSGGPRRPGPATPPPRSGARARLEKVSYPILVRLSSAPKWVLGVVTGAILLGGLLAPPPVGPALLGVVVLFLAWLLTLAWPRLQPGPRLIRLVVVLVMAGLVLAQATGGLP